MATLGRALLPEEAEEAPEPKLFDDEPTLF